MGSYLKSSRSVPFSQFFIVGLQWLSSLRVIASCLLVFVLVGCYCCSCVLDSLVGANRMLLKKMKI